MEKMTLNHLLDSHGIVIPIIQRDYVQGSNANSEKRDKFIDTLFSTLLGTNEQNLDFIYGRTAPAEGFIPIDGQQRLTTLFILTCAFSKFATIHRKDDNTAIALLSKFKYKTRTGANRFCQLLTSADSKFTILSKNDIETETNEKKSKPSEELKENTKFNSAWMGDPTVASMLDILDEIAKRLSTYSEAQILQMYSRLCAGAICFDSLDMEDDDFKLSDDLYIKMNARGKQLTEFENFKAQLIEFVEMTYPERKDEICQKLEYDWTQLFWNTAFEEWDALSEQEKRYRPYPVVDTFFMNFLSLLTQLLFFKDKSDKTPVEAFTGSFQQYTEIYKVQENFDLLVDSLDWLYAIANGNKQEMDVHFSNIFSINCNPSEIKDKVRIFLSGLTSPNVFDAAIRKGIEADTQIKLLLFAYLYQCSKFKDAKIKEYMRLIRNYIESNTQKDKNGYSFAYELRVNDFRKHFKMIEQLAGENPLDQLSKATPSGKFIAHEISKRSLLEKYPTEVCALESFDYLKGNLALLMPANESDFPAYAKAIFEIWQQNHKLISQAMIACGFNGLYTKDCALGELYAYGEPGIWHRILTDVEASAKTNWLTTLLDKYISQPEETPAEKLKAIITEEIKNCNMPSWRLSFLKHESMLSDKPYFSFRGEYNAEKLGSTGKNPLLAYHVNPYVMCVCKYLKINAPWQQYSHSTGEFSYKNLILSITENGWKITGNLPNQEILQEYDINPSDPILSPNGNEDIVDIAVRFLQEIP